MQTQKNAERSASQTHTNHQRVLSSQQNHLKIITLEQRTQTSSQRLITKMRRRKISLGRAQVPQQTASIRNRRIEDRK
jgi:hypothetical protein